MPTIAHVPAPRTFRYLRQALPWLLALATATCSQDQLEPSRANVGYFSFRPVYALAGGAHLSQFGIIADSVHVRLTRPVNQLVLDTTVFFPPDSGQLKLALPVKLEQSPESLLAAVEISAAGVVVFSDTVGVEVQDGPPGSSPVPTVTFKYVGPGTNIGALQLVPGDTTIVLLDTLFFSAVAFDSSAAPVASFYVGWKTTDTTVARINANGRLIAPAARGSVGVVGMTPTGIADTTIVTFAPVPVIILADSGNGLSGLVADSVGALFVARVKGADSLGIPGIPVQFKAVTGGGAIRDTLVYTDAQGRARTRAVLGDTIALYTYSATVATKKTLTVNFTATATPAAASGIAILTGNAQVDTAGDLLPAPLVVKVTDAFTNPVAGAQVIFSDLAGPAAADTVVTIANGTASAPFTLRPTVGADSVRASLVGTSGSVVFTLTAVAGAPAAVAVDSGNTQSATVATAFPESLVARVTDIHGNAVGGAKVAWIVLTGGATLSNDTTLSAADGRARVGMTAGTSAGALHVQASAAGAVSTAQFAVTVLPGAPSAIVAVSGDTQSTLPGGVLAQPVLVAVRDAFGNGIPGKTVSFAVIAGLGTVDSASATTDASGFANSGRWTLGPVAGTNQVRVTLGVLPADTLVFTATGLPAGTTKQWTGAVSGLWSIAGNWSPSGVPTAGDNVFIPVTATAPIVDFNQSIGGLQVEAGATVSIAAVTLNTSGNVQVLGTVTGSGLFSANGSGTTLAGTFAGPLLGVQGTVLQSGPISSTGPITISAGSLAPNGFPLTTAVNFTVSGTGLLKMTNAADSVDVGGSFLVSSTTSSTGSLTAGVLVLRSSFTQNLGANTNFAPSGTHRTRFLGASPQTIAFATPGSANSRFQEIEFGTPGGVTLGSTVTVMGNTVVSAGTITGIGRTINLGGSLATPFAAWQVSNTLWGQNPASYPDSLPRNVTVFGPWTLTKPFKADSSLTVSSGGTLTLNGFALRLGGGLTQTGILRMQNSADTLDVTGPVTVNSAISGTGDLSAGLLILRQSLSQSGAGTSFRPTGAHRTLITSTGSVALGFASATSGFNHVTFAAVNGTAITGNVTVSGNILAQTGVVSSPDTLVMTGDTLTRGPAAVWAMTATDVQTRTPELPDSVSGTLILRDTVSLSAPLFVLNDLILDGNTSTLLPNQHRVWTDGTLKVRNGGLMEMSAGDTVHVTGNATFTGRPTNGTLTGGRLELEGNLSVLDDSGFVAGPAHETVMSGVASPILFVSVAAAGRGEFGVLDLTAASGGITLATDVRVAGALRKAASSTVNVAGAGHVITVDGDLSVDDMIFDQARLVVRDADNIATFDNVSFIDQDPTKTQFAFTGPGGTDTLKFHNIGFGTVPTTGHYVSVADSTANGLPVRVAFYNSTPLNGAANELTDATGGDAAKILWSRLVWYQLPDSVTQGGLFPLPPKLAAVDPDSVLLSSYTGTVKIGFAVDPSGGLAVLTGDSVAAVGGVATFDSLRVSLAFPGYVFQGSSPELGTSPPSGTFIVLAPLPPGTTTAFTNGGGDGSWDTPSNWTAGIPDSADNIFIYPNLTVTVNNPSRANRVTIGTGSAILLNSTLAVDSSIAAGNTISGGGTLIAQGSGTLSGQMGELLITGSYTVLGTDTLTASSIDVEGSGLLDAGLGDIRTTGVLFTGQSGHLNVANAASKVIVGTNLQLAGGASTFTAGTLHVGGNATIAGPASAVFAPAFTTDFDGKGHLQAVSFAGSDSINGLGGVRMTGDSVAFLTNTWVTGPLNLDSGVTILDSTLFATQPVGGTAGAALQGSTLSVGNTLAFPGTYAVGTTVFAGGGLTIPALSSAYDTVLVAGTAQLGTTVNAQLFYVVANGQFDLNGHRLNVTGDFGTGGSGTFAMKSPADSLFVGGSVFTFGGATTGLLTHGLLQVTGSFFQGSTPLALQQQVEFAGPPPAGDGFHADTGHVTRFVGGAAPRDIFFSTPLQPPGSGTISVGASSQFGTLEIVDGTDTIASIVPVAGTTTIGAAEVTGPGTLAAIGPLTVLPTAVGVNVSSLYTGGGLDYQAPVGTFGAAETFFFGGSSVPVLPYQWLRVGFTSIPMAGDLHVSQVTIGGQGEGQADSYGGELLMNGHALTTTGNFILGGFGQFAMTAASDSLDVGGNFTAAGGDMNGRLIDGVIVARGSVYLQPNWVDSTFVASGTHRFRMAAAGAADLWVTQGVGDPIRFNRLTVDPGTTVNFNQFSSGALVVADTFAVHGFFLQASPAQKVIDLGALYVGTSVGITVDTLELHQGIDVDLSTFSTQLVRYAGTGQVVDSFVPYHDLEVTGTAALQGLTTVNHDLRVRGSGTLALAGHRANVTDSLQVSDSGLLVMTNPADTAEVGVTASFDGRDSDGWLTAGVLRFNYFTQGATTSPNAFRATGTHKAVLLEVNPLDNTDFIHFATPGINASRFQEFTIDGGGSGFTYLNGGTIVVADSFAIPAGGSGGVFATSTTMKVGGPMVVQTGTIPIQFDTLELQGSVTVPSSVLSSNVTRFAGVGQQIPDTQNYNRLEVTGTATLEAGGGDVVASDVAITGNGHLTLGNLQEVTSNGPFTTSENGTLTMNDPTSTLFVNGTATFGGGSTAGKLTAGTLQVLGDLVQTAATSDSAFHPASGFLTQFTGARRHVVTFASADLNFGANFGKLEVTAYDSLDINGGHPAAIGPTLLDPNGVLYDTPRTGTFQPTGPFTAGSFSQIHLFELVPRDTFTVDPTATYDVTDTHFAFFSGTVPTLAYQNIMFEDGAPTLGGNVIASGFVTVFGTQFTGGGGVPMVLTFGGHTLTAASFGTGAYGGIVMDQPGDSLIVNGPASFRGQTELGKLTAGTIRFGGDLATDTVSGGARSAFVTEGTTVELVGGVPHDIHFFDPDSSYLPALTGGDAVALQLHITGRARIAGDLNLYGLDLTGDTLVVDSTLTGGPAGASATLRMLRTGQIYGGTSFSTYAIGTTQFTAPGSLLSLSYDTLIVSDTLRGGLSQVVSANRLIVTGPGSPLHAGPHPGWLFLDGGDGNTTVNVSGDAIVEGTGAAIFNNFGTLSTSGDLLVQSNGLLVATTTGCCGQSIFDIGGNATFNGASTKDSLTSGLLLVGGNFTQGGPDFESFVADSDFVTKFQSAGTHVISFADPTAAGGNGSHFGSLELGNAAGIVLQTAGPVWVAGTLIDTTFSSPTLQGTSAGVPTLTVQDVDVQGITFDHLQLHLQKNGAPHFGVSFMDIVNFTNFAPSDTQFVVDLPGTPTQFNWSNFSFFQLNTGDAGRYVVANDIDGGTPDVLTISLGTNQGTVADLPFFVGLNGAIINPFAP